MINTKCSLYVVLDTAIYGDTNSGWGGFTALKDKISNISALLNSTSTTISNFFSDNGWIVSDIESQIQLNYNIYNKYNSSKFASPNPNSTTSINSLFITSGLGPIGISKTMTDIINQALTSTYQVIL